MVVGGTSLSSGTARRSAFSSSGEEAADPGSAEMAGDSGDD
jgi:hypothetical protein